MLTLGFAEVWIVAILALIFLLIGRNFASYELSHVTGHPYHTNVTWNDDAHPPNTEVPYPELEGFTYFTDSGMFFFGVVLLGYGMRMRINTAMKLGDNWPIGPLEWGERLGWSRSLGVLEELRELRGEAYRPAPELRARAS